MSRNLRGPHIRNKRKDPEIKMKVEQVLDKAKLNERERERESLSYLFHQGVCLRVF